MDQVSQSTSNYPKFLRNSTSAHRRLKPTTPGQDGLRTNPSIQKLESKNINNGLFLSNDILNQDAFQSGSKKDPQRPPSTANKLRPVSRPNIPMAQNKPMSRGRQLSGMRNKFVSDASKSALSPPQGGISPRV